MTLSPNHDEQAYQLFIQETLECLEKIEQILLNLQQDFSVPKIRELVRAAHTIKGGAAQVNLTDIQTLADRLEKIFRSLSQEKFETDWELLELLMQAYELLRLSLLNQIHGDNHNGSDNLTKAEPVFTQLEAKLQQNLIIENDISTTTLLGDDVKELIFNTEIAEALEYLENVLANSSAEELLPQLQKHIAIFLDVGELLEMSEFVAIAKTTLASLKASPQAAEKIGQLALAGFRAATEKCLQENYSSDTPAEQFLAVDSRINEEPTNSSLEDIFAEFVSSQDANILPENGSMPVTSMAAPSPVQPPEAVRENRAKLIELPEFSAVIATENPTDTELANLLPDRKLKLKTSKLMVWQADLTILVLPYNRIEDNLSADSERIIYSNQQRFLYWRGQMIRVYQLSELLSYNYPLSQTHPSQVSRGIFSEKNRIVSRLVIREGELLFALESPIDRLVTESELAIEPFGSALAAPQYIYGCTILADELALPTIDLIALVYQFFDHSNQPSTPTQLLDAPETETIASTVAHTTSSSNVTDKVPTVLIVDDSLSWRHSLSVTLQKAGYQVLQAQDGREGIEQLQQNSTIQLVISDVEMPRLNGFGFLSYCRKDPLLSKVPVILLSTCNSKQHLQLAKYLGATAYFTKPYQELEFLASIQTILSSRVSVSGGERGRE
ncbi:MAG: response regulator [Prochloraceae cyanobacterium]